MDRRFAQRMARQSPGLHPRFQSRQPGCIEQSAKPEADALMSCKERDLRCRQTPLICFCILLQLLFLVFTQCLEFLPLLGREPRFHLLVGIQNDSLESGKFFLLR
jgi:hypothetical protein